MSLTVKKNTEQHQFLKIVGDYTSPKKFLTIKIAISVTRPESGKRLESSLGIRVLPEKN